MLPEPTLETIYSKVGLERATSQLVLARLGSSRLYFLLGRAVFLLARFGSSQIVISSWLGEPKRADLFYIKTSEIYACKMYELYFYLNFHTFIKNFGTFQEVFYKNVGSFWLELNFLWLVLARAKYF